ncbi:hypothetical protein ACFXKR_24690 [Streptomyces violascens]|uniref:hypothetical protein n=1 Tax=Streptomyces violascens TaxID=67381 RepID=UPI0036B988BA
MLRIVEELAGPGPLRICAHAPADGAAGTGLRVLLIADVLARVVEMRGRAVLIGWAGSHDKAAAAAAGIRPPDAEGDPDEIAEALGGLPGVQLTTGTYEGAGSACLQIGEAQLPPFEGLDLLAVRLLLLSHPYEEPVSVTAEQVREAGRAMARWRRAVADWAEQPSKPIPADLKSTARTALDNRLDTAAVLRLLHDLATAADVPQGAKFETMAYLDRVLGLELVREVGISGGSTPGS